VAEGSRASHGAAAGDRSCLTFVIPLNGVDRVNLKLRVMTRGSLRGGRGRPLLGGARLCGAGRVVGAVVEHGAMVRRAGADL
jgi:hypothetical protein